MNGRTIALILFVWALLTVITPTLVRMSASAKLLDGIQTRGMKSRLLSRRALMDTRFNELPSHEPEPVQGPAPGPAPGVFWRSKLGLCSMCYCPEVNGRPCLCCSQ
ncbi:hypothetical protein DCAR_0623683 [Daucus carota subsp. sativus]|uniref:Uncharacterized protein n=1 Tax=Daucus carota subsp. sativus TaxID=79200 RepID=A0AAF0XC35_DAUCS|nr:PREDICTED: uncharacterized protein LOC108227070 [Daucus carota subsp. sativus]WOH04274.1 hypothetical protein DCAR_0623683 [Daucus carota subsp. sativus]